MDDPTQERSFSCVKCNGTEYETGEIRTTGSGISRYLNLQNQKFGVITCSNCGYSEMYRLDGKGGWGTIFDILTNQKNYSKVGESNGTCAVGHLAHLFFFITPEYKG